MMFPPRTILAAIDFSEPSRSALVMAGRLAAHCSAHLHVLYAEDPLIGAAARAAHMAIAADAQAELAAFTCASALPPQIAVHPHVIEGRAADVICTIGRREQADLIVVGTHGLSAVDRLVFGSTAEAVLRCSELPVLLVPPTWRPPRGTRTDLTGCGPVVVGVDFTVGSFQAIAAAFTLARLLRVTLVLVHVVTDVSTVAARRPQVEDLMTRQEDAARGELTRLARGLTSDVLVETRVERGAVPQALAELTQSLDGDPLLVLGRRLPRSRHDVPGAIAHRAALLSQVPTVMYMATEAGD